MSRRWRRSAEDRQRSDEERAALEARIAAAIQADAHAQGAHLVEKHPRCLACNPGKTAGLAESGEIDPNGVDSFRRFG